MAAFRITFLTRRLMRRLLIGVMLIALAVVPLRGARADAAAPAPKPTVVLVHGAWADTSSWRGVVERLQHDGYRAVSVPNPLRSLSGDSAYLAEYLHTLRGPLILVGHSYGAAVITNAATGNDHVKGLVFVDGAVPAQGETVLPLAGPHSALAVKDPSTVFNTVPGGKPVSPATDLYLKDSTFRDDFANGLSADQIAVLGASQRPITIRALNEKSGPPAWRTIPSWYLIGTLDHIIPPDEQQAMAAKAGSTVVTFRAGHLGLISDPMAVVHVVEAAATAKR